MTDHSNYPHYDLDRLKAIPFGAVVERVDELRRKGCRGVTRCPWHDDKHPSLTLYERSGENHCHCFSCGKGGSTIDYIMAHEGLDFNAACQWLGNEFAIPTTEGHVTIRHHRRKVAKSVKPDYTYIPMDIVEDMMTGSDSLTRCLSQVFDAMLVRHVANDYLLGCYESWRYADNVVFPSIDRWGRVHNLKTQHYQTDPSHPDFCHCDKQHILWLGSMLAKDGTLPRDAEFDNQCFFGEHLLNRYPKATVAMVESPKNAIVGACHSPEYVWIASGSKNLLNRDMLQALCGRRVIVIPDRDAIEYWTDILRKNRDIAHFEILHQFFTAMPPEHAKSDIADIILAERMAKKG